MSGEPTILTAAQHQELREIAEGALLAQSYDENRIGAQDALLTLREFEDAVTPQVVLGLLAEVEGLRVQRDFAREHEKFLMGEVEGLRVRAETLERALTEIAFGEARSASEKGRTAQQIARSVVAAGGSPEGDTR